jgi:phosphoserine phosphatase RsbU/P
LSGIDAIAYIPLFCTALAALVLCVFLIIIKIRNTAKVSFIVFLTLAIELTGCINTIFAPGMMRFALYQFVATSVLIPYCVMLALGKTKPKDEKNETAEDSGCEPVPETKELTADEINLLDTGRGFLLEAANAFSRKDGLTGVLDAINTTVMSVCHADGGAILLVDDFDDIVSVKSFSGDFPPPYRLPADLPHKPIRVSTSFKFAQFSFHDNIFGNIVTTGKPEMILNSVTDERIFQNSPEEFLRCGTYIFIPMKTKDTVIGLIALAKKPGGESFAEQDFSCAQILSDFAAAAVRTMFSFNEFVEHTELTKETTIACRLQDTLMPKKIPALTGVSFGSFSDQSAGVCGDYYDVIASRRDRVSFILADIAGKGMNSLIIMVMLRSMFRLIVNTTQTAGTILSWANRGICSETTVDHFGSAALINYDPTHRQFQIATGGTTPVFYYAAAKKTFEQISVAGDPIGVEKLSVYKDINLTAHPGDILVTCSDGLIEALNPEGKQYTTESLSKLIVTNSSLPGKDIANLVKNDIKKFSGSEKLHDDQTLLVIKIQ